MQLLNISCHVRCKQKKNFRFYSDKKNQHIFLPQVCGFLSFSPLKKSEDIEFRKQRNSCPPITQNSTPLSLHNTLLYKLYTFFSVIPPLPALSKISSSGQKFRQQRSRCDLEDEVGNTAVHDEYNAFLWKLHSRRSIWNFSYQYEGGYELAFA